MAYSTKQGRLCGHGMNKGMVIVNSVMEEMEVEANSLCGCKDSLRDGALQCWGDWGLKH